MYKDLFLFVVCLSHRLPFCMNMTVWRVHGVISNLFNTNPSTTEPISLWERWACLRLIGLNDLRHLFLNLLYITFLQYYVKSADHSWQSYSEIGIILATYTFNNWVWSMPGVYQLSLIIISGHPWVQFYSHMCSILNDSEIDTQQLHNVDLFSYL